MPSTAQLPEPIRLALAAEEHARGLAWLPMPPDLLGVPQSHLTPRSRNDLLLAGNAFFTGRPPAHRDVFEFLWRHHPAYATPRRPALHARARGSRLRLFWLWRIFGSLPRAAHYYRIERHVARLDPAYAAAPIYDYLLRVFQDRPCEDVAAAPSGPPPLFPPPQPYWLDDWVDWACARYGGLTPETALDQPIARLLQLRRRVALLCGEPVIDPSRGLFAAHLRHLRDTGTLRRN